MLTRQIIAALIGMVVLNSCFDQPQTSNLIGQTQSQEVAPYKKAIVFDFLLDLTGNESYSRYAKVVTFLRSSVSISSESGLLKSGDTLNIYPIRAMGKDKIDTVFPRLLSITYKKTKTNMLSNLDQMLKKHTVDPPNSGMNDTTATIRAATNGTYDPDSVRVLLMVSLGEDQTARKLTKTEIAGRWNVVYQLNAGAGYTRVWSKLFSELYFKAYDDESTREIFADAKPFRKEIEQTLGEILNAKSTTLTPNSITGR